MIFVTGDTHGRFTRLNRKRFPEQRELGKDDYVIVCGDFGIWSESHEERENLDWLNSRSFTTLFVTGNHSNYDLLSTFPVQTWKGGKVQLIRDSVILLMRGQVFEIAVKRIFTMGGASSHDISDGILEPDDPEFDAKRQLLDRRYGRYRINHVSWWREELPSDAEYGEARRNLERCGWEVDYIVSHCCPTSIQDIISDGEYVRDRLTDFFDEVRERCKFKFWFFGHYHYNRRVEEKFVLLYEEIVQMDPME